MEEVQAGVIPSKAGRGYIRKAPLRKLLTPDSIHITISEKIKRNGS
jgi:hypothetical protein